jgi:hypothetical protein
MSLHITEERLNVLANDHAAEASEEEDAHITDCKTCLMSFVELVSGKVQCKNPERLCVF